MSNDLTKTETRTVFMAVYEVTREYGGPEEGGWWYDWYHFTGSAIPVKSTVVYYAGTVDSDLDEHLVDVAGFQTWADDNGDRFYWYPESYTPVNSEWYETAQAVLEEEYGLEKEPSRFSMAQRGNDYAMMLEITPGYRSQLRRPRYE